jgi:hypothetical protein
MTFLDYISFDFNRVIEALDGLGPIEAFVQIVRAIER